METAVLMEVEKLRRASLAVLRAKYREVFEEETRCRNREHLFRRIAWRLQALAEGDLSERARGRARQIARDADLRTVAPRDFFTVGGERVRSTPGRAVAATTIAACPCRVLCSVESGKDETFWSRCWRRDSGMRISNTPRSARSR